MRRSAAAATAAARAAAAPAAPPLIRHDPLWADLDDGRGQWENVPATVRAAFRAVLGAVDASSGRITFLAADAADGAAAADARIGRLEEAWAAADAGARGTQAALAALKT
jgi:hypothetical protein